MWAVCIQSERADPDTFQDNPNHGQYGPWPELSDSLIAVVGQSDIDAGQTQKNVQCVVHAVKTVTRLLKKYDFVQRLS